MGKPTGFLEYKRADNKVTEPLERIKSCGEFRTQLDEEERRRQGARCMNCGVPFCQSAISFEGSHVGCPLHNLIPEWNDEIYNGNYSHALDRLLKTNNFPEFTGRVCPALCERACICGRYGDPVTVHENELFIIEHAFADGLIKPRVPAIRSGKSVAVIGSGPAGLACADQLNHRGHSVTVYEKSDRIGGLLMYGIPNMKLDKSIVDRRVRLMQAEGVSFVTCTAVGNVDKASENAKSCAQNKDAVTAGTEAGIANDMPDGDDSKRSAAVQLTDCASVQSKDICYISADEIVNRYDAVVLCCGAEVPRKLEAWEAAKSEGKNISGVYYAMDYLKAETKHLLDGTSEISAKGLNTVIVGAGDTANDCIAAAVRQGAASITQIVRRAEGDRREYAWPAFDESRSLGYGQEEAIAVYGRDPRVFETGISALKSDETGSLSSVITVRLKRVSGRYEEVPGSEAELKAELMIVASGFAGCDKTVEEAFGAKLHAEDAGDKYDHRTSAEGLFAAGDMRTGASLVARAMADGRDCASQVDEYLIGYRVLERLEE